MFLVLWRIFQRRKRIFSVEHHTWINYARPMLPSTRRECSAVPWRKQLNRARATQMSCGSCRLRKIVATILIEVDVCFCFSINVAPGRSAAAHPAFSVKFLRSATCHAPMPLGDLILARSCAITNCAIRGCFFFEPSMTFFDQWFVP